LKHTSWAFWSFYLVFLLLVSWRIIWFSYIYSILFKWKKLLARERSPCTSDGVSRWPKISFHCVIGSAAASSCCWCSACWRRWNRLLSIKFLFNFLSPPYKIIVWFSLLLIFQLPFLFFWFLILVIDFFVKVLFVFNFIF